VENQGGKNNGFYSRKLKAGKRRTYFFDVRDTKQGDFYLTITESKKKFDGDGYESHKIFLYKEDFKKFMEALNDTVNHVKTELMPDFDYDADRFIPTQESNSNYYQQSETKHTETPPSENPTSDYISTGTISDDEEIKW